MTIALITILLIVILGFREVEGDFYDNTGQEEFDRRMKERYPDWKGL